MINEMSAAELRDVDAGVRDHIDSCESCSEAYQLRVTTSQALAAAAGGVRAGDTFKRRIMDAIDREAGEAPASIILREKPVFSWRALFRPSPVWAALALVLVLFSGYNYLRTLGYFSPRGEFPADMGRFVDDVGHDAYLYTRQQQTFELLTQSPADVREWFSSRLDFPVDVSATLAGGYRMEGIRLWHTVSRLSALVSYETPQGAWIALFVISADNLADRGEPTVRGDHRLYHVGESYQYNAVAWQEGGVAYALVAQLPPDELVEIAEGFQP
jgi:anti-sigma factor RsiW